MGPGEAHADNWWMETNWKISIRDDLMFVGLQFDMETTTECFYKGDASPRYDMADKIHIVFNENPKSRVLKRIIDDLKRYLEGH